MLLKNETPETTLVDRVAKGRPSSTHVHENTPKPTCKCLSYCSFQLFTSSSSAVHVGHFPSSYLHPGSSSTSQCLFLRRGALFEGGRRSFGQPTVLFGSTRLHHNLWAKWVRLHSILDNDSSSALMNWWPSPMVSVGGDLGVTEVETNKWAASDVVIYCRRRGNETLHLFWLMQSYYCICIIRSANGSPTIREGVHNCLGG